MSASLVPVSLTVSGVVCAGVGSCWNVVRSFGGLQTWMPVCRAELLDGEVDGRVGAIRVIRFEQDSYLEQMTALDEDAHLMKWRVISHPNNSNPFKGSFLNFTCTMQLKDVTMGNWTFMKFDASFDTDLEVASEMRDGICRCLEAGIQTLRKLLSRNAPQLTSHVPAAPLSKSMPMQGQTQPQRSPQFAPAPPPTSASAYGHVCAPPAWARPPLQPQQPRGPPVPAEAQHIPWTVAAQPAATQPWGAGLPEQGPMMANVLASELQRLLLAAPGTPRSSGGSKHPSCNPLSAEPAGSAPWSDAMLHVAAPLSLSQLC